LGVSAGEDFDQAVDEAAAAAINDHAEAPSADAEAPDLESLDQAGPSANAQGAPEDSMEGSENANLAQELDADATQDHVEVSPLHDEPSETSAEVQAAEAERQARLQQAEEAVARWEAMVDRALTAGAGELFGAHLQAQEAVRRTLTDEGDHASRLSGQIGGIRAQIAIAIDAAIGPKMEVIARAELTGLTNNDMPFLSSRVDALERLGEPIPAGADKIPQISAALTLQGFAERLSNDDVRVPSATRLLVERLESAEHREARAAFPSVDARIQEALEGVRRKIREEVSGAIPETNAPIDGMTRESANEFASLIQAAKRVAREAGVTLDLTAEEGALDRLDRALTLKSLTDLDYASGIDVDENLLEPVEFNRLQTSLGGLARHTPSAVLDRAVSGWLGEAEASGDVDEALLRRAYAYQSVGNFLGVIPIVSTIAAVPNGLSKTLEKLARGEGWKRAIVHGVVEGAQSALLSAIPVVGNAVSGVASVVDGIATATQSRTADLGKSRYERAIATLREAREARQESIAQFGRLEFTPPAELTTQLQDLSDNLEVLEANLRAVESLM
ncbi:MAG: hypothetical protein EA397_17945, partial [Deltaproteobacteria bacterium]